MMKYACIYLALPFVAWARLELVAPVGSAPEPIGEIAQATSISTELGTVTRLSDVGIVSVDMGTVGPLRGADPVDVSVESIAELGARDSLAYSPGEVGLLDKVEREMLDPEEVRLVPHAKIQAIATDMLKVQELSTLKMGAGNIFPVDALEDYAPPSLMRHPRFTKPKAAGMAWDKQLERYDAVMLGLRARLTSAPVLENVDQYRIVSIHYNRVLESPENHAVTDYLLSEVATGYNGIIIPYRFHQDPEPAAWLSKWASEQFDLVLIALTAHTPWPTVEDMQARLDLLLENADGAISSWGPSIDLGAVFDPGNESEPRALTVKRISMWLDEQIAARGKYALGYMYDMVHGTQERPARPGGRAGANFRYLPEGLSAYICANIQPDGTSVTVLGPEALQRRLEPIPEGGGVILGPFLQWSLADRDRLDQVAGIYHSMGYGIIKKVYRVE